MEITSLPVQFLIRNPISATYSFSSPALAVTRFRTGPPVTFILCNAPPFPLLRVKPGCNLPVRAGLKKNLRAAFYFVAQNFICSFPAESGYAVGLTTATQSEGTEVYY